MDNYLIGSTCDDFYGVGTLFKWKEDEVKYYWDKVEENWVITENKGGDVVKCFDLMKLEWTAFGLEESDIQTLKE